MTKGGGVDPVMKGLMSTSSNTLAIAHQRCGVYVFCWVVLKFTTPLLDGSAFLQLKMAGAGLPGVGISIKDLSDTGETHEVAPYSKLSILLSRFCVFSGQSHFGHS